MLRIAIDILKAAKVDLDSVTVVVTNLDMKTQIRPRTVPARRGIGRVADVMREPLKTVRRRPGARSIALALSGVKIEGFPDGLSAVSWTDNKTQRGAPAPLCTIDVDFVRAMKALGETSASAARVIRGTTEIYTKVLRAGILTESDPTFKARLMLDGRPVDIALGREVERTRVIDVLRTGAWAKVTLDARWYKYPSGEVVLDPAKTKVISMAPWSPISGREFLGAIKDIDLSTLDANEILTDRRGDE